MSIPCLNVCTLYGLANVESTMDIAFGTDFVRAANASRSRTPMVGLVGVSPKNS